jgi:hypothetical protein
MFPPEKADTVLRIVDRWTKIMRQVNRQDGGPSSIIRPISACSAHAVFRQGQDALN